MVCPILNFFEILLDNMGFISYNSRVAYLGVAQFGSVLEWGSRGREFKSPHSDHKKIVSFSDAFFFIS